MSALEVSQFVSSWNHDSVHGRENGEHMGICQDVYFRSHNRTHSENESTQ